MASKRSIEKERNGSLDSQLTAYSAAAEARLALDAGRAKRPNRPIVAYSAAAAGAGLLGALNVEAAIQYTPVAWTIKSSSRSINFDGGGGDFSLQHATNAGKLLDRDTDGSIATDGGGKAMAYAFANGDTISAGHANWGGAYGLLYRTFMNTGAQFGPGASGYLGVRFVSGVTTVYGWIHIDSVEALWTDGYHVAAYGYQTDGTASHAGEQPVPEPSTIALALLASGAAGVMASRRKKILKGRK